jgi:hypothetical protein
VTTATAEAATTPTSSDDEPCVATRDCPTPATVEVLWSCGHAYHYCRAHWRSLLLEQLPLRCPRHPDPYTRVTPVMVIQK